MERIMDSISFELASAGGKALKLPLKRKVVRSIQFAKSNCGIASNDK